jgi:hypothetical protein
MTYNEYINQLEDNFPKILDENLLFWNLWNISYPFEILEKYKENYIQYYSIFNKMWVLCWKFIDSKNIDIQEFHDVFDDYYPFIFKDDGSLLKKSILQEEYDNFDDAYLCEACIIQLIHRFNNIYDGIINNKRYGDNAFETPISIISVILDSNDLGFSIDNTDLLIVKDEMKAQIKLVKKLSKSQSYIYRDRNIYRKEKSMGSIKYKE